MERRTEKILVFIALIAAAVGLRLYFQVIPNFAPIAAVALFAGFYFSNRWFAVLVPIGAMLISDQFIGGYQPFLMAVVYSFLILPAFLGSPLRKILQDRGAMTTTLSLVGCSLTSSLLFFVATNFACWLVSSWYPRSLAGLWQCYVAAIPFFRYTLMGDLFFAGVLFGGYALFHAKTTATTLNRVSVD